MTVNNLSEVTKALDGNKAAIKSLANAVDEMDLDVPDEVTVSNLRDMKIETKFPKEAIKLLKLLENLKTSAKNPLSVRLSDGKSYYNAIAKAVQTGTSVAMGGITRPSAVTSGSLALSDAGTAVQVSSTSTTIRYVLCQCTGGIVVVGDSNAVATSGSEVGSVMAPFNPPIKIEIDNINKLYAAGASGSRLVYNYVTV